MPHRGATDTASDGRSGEQASKSPGKPIKRPETEGRPATTLAAEEEWDRGGV